MYEKSKKLLEVAKKQTTLVHLKIDTYKESGKDVLGTKKIYMYASAYAPQRKRKQRKIGEYPEGSIIKMLLKIDFRNTRYE